MKVVCASILTCSNRHCAHREPHERDSIKEDPDSCQNGLGCEYQTDEINMCDDAATCLRPIYGCISVEDNEEPKKECPKGKGRVHKKRNI